MRPRARRHAPLRPSRPCPSQPLGLHLRPLQLDAASAPPANPPLIHGPSVQPSAGRIRWLRRRSHCRSRTHPCQLPRRPRPPPPCHRGVPLVHWHWHPRPLPPGSSPRAPHRRLPDPFQTGRQPPCQSRRPCPPVRRASSPRWRRWYRLRRRISPLWTSLGAATRTRRLLRSRVAMPAMAPAPPMASGASSRLRMRTKITLRRRSLRGGPHRPHAHSPLAGRQPARDWPFVRARCPL